MRDSLGLRTDAHQLWRQALMLAEQECQALGLKERQVQYCVECFHFLRMMHACMITSPCVQEADASSMSLSISTQHLQSAMVVCIEMSRFKQQTAHA